MKIIFSRKGFDGAAGGFPSLIFPDNTLFSIPIPSNPSHCDYSKLAFRYKGEPIQNILNQVTKNKIHHNKWLECDYTQAMQGCHHDPMRFPESNSLALGQTGNAESHLRNQGVTTGDIFIFYGWFRRVVKNSGDWMYDPNERNLHVIWSFMTVDQNVKLDDDNQVRSALVNYPVLASHPHLASDWSSIPNSIYLSNKFSLPKYSVNRCLSDTKAYSGRAQWRLPRFFNQPQAFSYLKIFRLEEDEVVINYRGYGQEFVLDLSKVVSNTDQQKIIQYVNEISRSD